ncbi:hypothetical protein T10_613 [Trichinella papuae]|uniref:Uncharacterized protein n=1 Tax=Trichinella papuae TaxID=268474 RepID=A0A0V1MN93_9BILA|nr:hypothetical protein T10_613 [Trichinella papuae]
MKNIFALYLKIYNTDKESRNHDVQFHFSTRKKLSEEEGDAANGRLVYGSTGSAIPDACSRLVNWSGHVWKCRISAFMLAQSKTA